jgi:WD40 repeat protein
MSRQYAAFISYSHAADGRLAPALQSALERFTKPWYRRRALRVFHDETNLSLNPSLWASIVEALDASEYFILLASPEAARSEWIRREVEHWLENRSLDSLLIVVTDGELRWDEAAGDFVWNDATPLLPGLRGHIHEEPRWLDLSWARDPQEHLSLGHSRFRESVAVLASVLHGRAKEELVGTEVREHRRALLLARSAVAALVALTLLSMGAALLALRQRDVAEKRQDEALRTQSLFLADLSRQQVSDGNVTNGILLALEALPEDDGDRPYVPEAEAALFDAVARHRERLLIDLPGDRVTAAIHDWSPNGGWLLTSSSGRARLWDAATGQPGPVFGEQPGGPIRDAGRLTGTVVAGAVLSGAFDPTSQRIATTSNNGDVYLWKARTGELLFEMKGHLNWSRSARFSPNGTRLVTVSNDGTARLWDPESGKSLHVLSHEAQVWTARFTPDGERVVTASSDRTARVWDVASGAEIAVLRGHEKGLSTAEFGPYGHRVVTGSWDGTARVWNAHSGSELTVVQVHNDGVTAVAMSRDGRRFATGSKKGGGELWDAETGALIQRLDGHTKEILTTTFDRCGKHLMTTSHDGTGRLWDADTGTLVGVLRGHEESFLSRVSLAFAPGCTEVATASRDGSVRVWSLETRRPAMVLDPPGRRDVRSADFAPLAGLVATSTGDNVAHVWDLASGNEVAVLEGHSAAVRWVSFAPDAARLVTASEDATARIWNSRTGVLHRALKGHETELWGAAWSPDGAHVLTWAWDNTARIWDAASGKPLHVLRGHQDFLYYASFSSDGRRILTASNDGTARVYDATNGKQVTALVHGEDTAVLTAVFSPDAKWAVTGASNRSVRVWNAATGALRSELRGHELHVFDVDWSPDGSLVVTGARDTTARIWDARTGSQLAVLGHDSWVRFVSFTPDGRRVITAEDDPALHLWDVETAKPVAVLRDARSTADLAWLQALSPDRRQVLGRTGDGRARIWRIYPSTSELVARARALVPRELTPDERRRFFLAAQ